MGRTAEELLACTFQDITHPDDLDADLARTARCGPARSTTTRWKNVISIRTATSSGSSWRARLVRDTEGEPVHFVAQIKDITARHEAEQRLQASLEEKVVLLREIHHRVKNNLQVITSLLQLQSGYLHDPRDAEIFKECQARIHAMGLVHDRLYRSGNLVTIDFSEHLRELTALIIRGQSNAPERIRLVVESDSVEVNLDTAIPLGLIATELITNAYKHAFRDRPDGAHHGASGTRPEAAVYAERGRRWRGASGRLRSAKGALARVAAHSRARRPIAGGTFHRYFRHRLSGES